MNSYLIIFQIIFGGGTIELGLEFGVHFLSFIYFRLTN